MSRRRDLCICSVLLWLAMAFSLARGEDSGARIDPTFSDANWNSMGGLPGVYGPRYGFNNVAAVAVDASGNLYIAGSFWIVGDIFATNIAKWDGMRWSALGSGVNSNVFALAVSGTNLYAAGAFTTAGGGLANHIARWDGSGWSPLGSGVDLWVNALAVSGTDVYAGGHLRNAGDVSAMRIAKWDGSTWSSLDSGLGGDVEGGGVYALAVSNGDLYAGGTFRTAGPVPATNIAKWNGSAWSALGSGVSGPPNLNPAAVRSLAVSGGDLYVGGNFRNAGGIAATNIAKWDGTTWSALSPGLNSTVLTLGVIGSNLYAGGLFWYIPGQGQAYNVAKWDGSRWSSLGPELTGSVQSFAVAGTNLYAGGYFTTIYVPNTGEIPANYIARWDGSAWSPLRAGINGHVNALMASGSNVFASATRDSTCCENTTAFKWDGNTWSSILSSTTYNSVSAFAVKGNDLYAAGAFSLPSGGNAMGVGKWNGSSWALVGSGMDWREMTAVAVIGNDLYAGGTFTMAGGKPANCIAKWDGSAWSALGSGIIGYYPSVSALAVFRSDLYVGGSFTNAGGVAANHIAMWDGTNWSSLGSGLNSSVTALAVSGDDVYVAGFFTNAGGIPAKGIAKWNGSDWFPLGAGAGGVRALAVCGNDLYVGGVFSSAGGVAASNIAKWDGSSWSALGSGVSGGDSGRQVYALAVSGSDLYVGGSFIIAGGKISPYVAKLRIGSSASSVVAANSSASIQFFGVVGYEYDVQRATSLTPPITWTTITTSPLFPTDDGSFTFTDANAPPGMAYYRTIQR